MRGEDEAGNQPVFLMRLKSAVMISLISNMRRLCGCHVFSRSTMSNRPDIGYIPTPQLAVDMMLSAAAVEAHDIIYDLGCGDGRILITAAQRFGTRGIGIDIDPERIQHCQQQAQQAGVCDRIQFRQANLFEVDFQDATVVALYLLPHLNLRLKPKLEQLRPGTRIVSHHFDIEGWTPNQTIYMTQTEEESVVYLWIV